jgi:predicted DNA-binding transcriptional regulator AlpA
MRRNDQPETDGRSPASSVAEVAADAANLPPLLVRRKVAARLCGVSVASWDRLHAAGKTPQPVRLGAALVWRIAELRAWTAAGCPPLSEWRAQWEALQKRQGK